MSPATPPNVTQALLRAAQELAAPGRGATLAELADRAQVGRQTARDLVPKLKQRGYIEIVGERRVEYRNRPVAEYAPTQAPAPELGQCFVILSDCVASWIR